MLWEEIFHVNLNAPTLSHYNAALVTLSLISYLISDIKKSKLDIKLNVSSASSPQITGGDHHTEQKNGVSILSSTKGNGKRKDTAILPKGLATFYYFFRELLSKDNGLKNYKECQGEFQGV